MKKIKTAIAILAMLVSGVMFSASVENYYVNGVKNNWKVAKESALELERRTNVGTINVLHNYTTSLHYDLLEAAVMSQDLDSFSLAIYNASRKLGSRLEDLSDILNQTHSQREGRVLVKSAKIHAFFEKDTAKSLFLQALNNPVKFSQKLLDAGFTKAEIKTLEFLNNVNRKVERLSSAFSNALFKVPNITEGVENNVQEMIETVHSSNEAFRNKRINLIAHSQGNSFALRLAKALESFGDAVRVVHVATPEGEVYKDSPYVTLKEDVASWAFLGKLPPNQTNFTPTDRQFEVLLRWFGGPKQIFTATTEVNRLKYGDPLGHGFVTSYLHREAEASDTGAIIPILYEANYRRLLKTPLPGEEYEKELYFGSRVSNSWNSDEKSKYRNGSYARTYVFRVNDECRKIQIDLESSVDTYLYLHKGKTLVKRDDDGGNGLNSRIITEVKKGEYIIEATTYGKGRKGDFNLSLNSLGNCQRDNHDIYLKAASLSSERVKAGEKILLSVQQWYSGNTRYNDLPRYPRVGYYLSKDTRWNSGDIFLGYDSSSIGSNDRYDSESEQVIIPPNTREGYWYILFVADYRDFISERNEDNNILYKRVYITYPESNRNDIYLKNSRIDDISVYRGQRVLLRTDVRYQGNQTVSQIGTVYLNYYISTKPYWDSSARLLGVDSSSIGSNDLVDGESFFASIPNDFPIGRAYIIFFVDPFWRIEEDNESNNQQFVRISVR